MPNESDMRGGMGNPDTVFCILLLCPEIAAWFGDSGSSSEKKIGKKESRAFVKNSVAPAPQTGETNHSIL